MLYVMNFSQQCGQRRKDEGKLHRWDNWRYSYGERKQVLYEGMPVLQVQVHPWEWVLVLIPRLLAPNFFPPRTSQHGVLFAARAERDEFHIPRWKRACRTGSSGGGFKRFHPEVYCGATGLSSATPLQRNGGHVRCCSTLW